MNKHLCVRTSIFLFVLLLGFVQAGYVFNEQPKISGPNVGGSEGIPINPQYESIIEMVKYYRGIGDNAKAVELLKTIPRNVETIPVVPNTNQKLDSSSMTQINQQDQKQNLSVLWDTTDNSVTASVNHERHPSMDVRYESTNDSEMYHVCEYWNGSTAPDKIRISRSMNHGHAWYQGWLFDNIYALSEPDMKQVSGTNFGVAMVSEYNASDHDIKFLRPSFTDLSDYTFINIDYSGYNDMHPAMDSDYFEYPGGAYLYVVYYRMEGSASKLMFSRSTNAGLTWEDPVVLASFSEQPSNPHCAIFAKNDVLCVAYTYDYSFFIFDYSRIGVKVSNDYGQTWGGEVLIYNTTGAPGLNPSITGSTANNWWVAYSAGSTLYLEYTTNKWSSSATQTNGTGHHPALGYRSGSYVYYAYLSGTSVEVFRTPYNNPTGWVGLGNVKNSSNSLTDDIPTMLVSQNPSGTYQGSVSWIHQYSATDYDAYFDAEWLPLATSTKMAVTPTSSFSSSGMAGGPFSPSSKDYLIENTGTATISYTVTKTQPWVTVTPTSGSLSGGNAVTLTVSINSNANSLPGGTTYSDTVTITNTTNGVGNTTRTVYLAIGAPPTLTVAPATGLESSGMAGGPYFPPNKAFTLKNNGTTGSLNWTATKTKSWLTLSAPTSGSLAAGATTTVTATINTNANALSTGIYTDTITFTNTTNSLGNTTRSVKLTIMVKNDFNQDGKPDILWRNYSTGLNYVWYMNGVTFTGAALVQPIPDTSWQIGGTGDFNGDGKVDILWRNYSTGLNYVWYMDGVTFTGAALVQAIPDTSWQIGGTGDFNGDGKPDILWRNYSTGLNYVWYMNGVTFTGAALVDPISDTSWQIGGTGDFNGDGKVDILWRNYSTGLNYVWYMNGVTFTGAALVEPIPDINWRIANR